MTASRWSQPGIPRIPTHGQSDERHLQQSRTGIAFSAKEADRFRKQIAARYEGAMGSNKAFLIPDFKLDDGRVRAYNVKVIKVKGKMLTVDVTLPKV